jgi:hypothetical protein
MTRANVTQRCRGAWAAACNGDRVDLDHESIQAAALKRGVDIGAPARAPTPAAKKPPPAPAAPTKVPEAAPAAPAEPTKRRRGAEPKPELPDQPENAGSDEDLDYISSILLPLIPRFGNGRGCKDWLSSQKDIETIVGKRQARQIARGKLVPREFVELHILGLIEGTHQRLITDTARSLVRDLYARARSDTSLEEAEKSVKKILGKQLDGLKTKAASLIRNAGSGRDNAERPRLASQPDRESDD